MILVTGHLGFVAGHLVEALRGAGEIVVGCDVCDDLFDRLKRHQISAVFNLGAISDTTCTDAVALREANIDLPAHLAGYCSEKSIPFIYASSAAVYGNGQGPLNAYAASKFLFDDMMVDLPRVHPWYGLRFHNVYGPGEAHKGKQASVIWQMKHAGLRSIFEAFAHRDFVHVADCVAVMLWLWRNLPPSGIYDVGTGRPETFISVAQLCRGNDFELVKTPAHLVGKYQFSTCADLKPLRAVGYDGTFRSVEQGVKDV